MAAPRRRDASSTNLDQNIATSASVDDNYPWSFRILLRSTTNFVDNHIQAFRSLSTVIALIGVGYIIKSTRPFSKFRHVRGIPKEFIKKNVRLRGYVKSVTNEHLNVEHIPIIEVKRFRWMGAVTKQDSECLLPVKIGGVELLEGAVPFLQLNAEKKHIWFVLLKLNTEGSVDCAVTVSKGWFRRININEAIVKEGLGKATPIEGITKHKRYLKLSQKLIKAEISAERKGKGIWTKPPRWEMFKNSIHMTAANVATRLRRRGNDSKLFLWQRIKKMFTKKDNGDNKI
ncbi:protein C3orf33 homolog [Saccoglossus kowalevskii]|uniref:Uncharacterized protein C3orf33 homolog n=1 Tax=Saccoglossus kowalevskii TaxID=10224 RepID=A0ABM0GUC6_SACKO|nr:PREDICTED: uncharacterized protein C3orf33 homolog [Saccoglossus kowalevskii]